MQQPFQSGSAVSTHSAKSSTSCTHNLLNRLDVIKAHPYPPRPPEMPTRLQRQILDHDAREHDELRVDLV